MSAQVCKSCGTQMPQNAQFCPNCGKKITARVCEACGAQIIEGARFCRNCGKEVGVRLCQNCGAKVPEGARFCPNCGKEAVLPVPLGKQPSYPHSPAKKSVLLPSFRVRLVLGLVVVAVVLFFWLGWPIIHNVLYRTSTTSDKTTKTTDTTTVTISAKSPWSDVPLYAGARPLQGDWSGLAGDAANLAVPSMKLEWHFYQIDNKGLTAAISFYKSKLPQTGWQYLTDTSDPSSGAATAVFMKDTEMLIVMTLKDPNAGCILGLCRGKM